MGRLVESRAAGNFAECCRGYWRHCCDFLRGLNDASLSGQIFSRCHGAQRLTVHASAPAWVVRQSVILEELKTFFLKTTNFSTINLTDQLSSYMFDPASSFPLPIADREPANLSAPPRHVIPPMCIPHCIQLRENTWRLHFSACSGTGLVTRRRNCSLRADLTAEDGTGSLNSPSLERQH